VSEPGARPTFAERLEDPLSHFPYKHDEALTAVGDDPAARAEVDATAAYVAAQEAYLRDPSEETRADEREAAQALQDVRRERRQAREQDETTRTAEREAAEALQAARDEDEEA